MSPSDTSDVRFTSAVCTILQMGLLLAAAFVLVGSIGYLAAHGTEYPRLRQFASEPAGERLAGRIVGGVFELRPASAIQFGALCLILTQIARVAYMLFGTTANGNRRHVLTVAVLLAILVSTFLSAAAGGV